MAGTPAQNGNNPAGNTDSSRKTVEMAHGAVRLASWPTPQCHDARGGSPKRLGRQNGGGNANLMDTVFLAAWTTPSASDGERGGTMTPGMSGSSLTQQATLAGWATPAARDYKHANARSFSDRIGRKTGEQLANQVVHSGPIATGSSAETGRPGQLNPAHSRWLMALPPAWDACAATVTRSARRRPSPSFALPTRLWPTPSVFD